MQWNRVRLPVAVWAVAAADCDGPQSALAPAGRDAERIAVLFWVMAIGALIIWAAVVLVAVYAIRSRRETHSQATANLLVIGGGVALPAVVLSALLAYGMPVLSAVMAPAPDGALLIEVAAKQWWWRVRYPGDGTAIETANEIHLPVGTANRTAPHQRRRHSLIFRSARRRRPPSRNMKRPSGPTR